MHPIWKNLVSTTLLALSYRLVYFAFKAEDIEPAPEFYRFLQFSIVILFLSMSVMIRKQFDFDLDIVGFSCISAAVCVIFIVSMTTLVQLSSSSLQHVKTAPMWATVSFFYKIIPEMIFNGVLLLEAKENVEEMKEIVTGQQN